MSLSKWLDPFGLFKTKKADELQPSSVEQPTMSEEGKVIGVLFGTRDIKALTYTYFGDVKQIAIKSKQGKK
jgi:hypothetical protein